MNKPLTLSVAVLPLALIGGCACDPLVGAWRSQVQFTEGDYAAITDCQFLYAFNQGGTMTESSNYDSSPPVAPAYGVWRSLGSRRFEASYTFFTCKPPEKSEQLAQSGWAPSGRGELHELIQLAPDGRTFESTITYRLFDTAGRPIPDPAGSGKATGRAERIGY